LWLQQSARIVRHTVSMEDVTALVAATERTDHPTYNIY
jgi:hypothetical protein